jgi:hypothetical protein
VGRDDGAGLFTLILQCKDEGSVHKQLGIYIRTEYAIHTVQNPVPYCLLFNEENIEIHKLSFVSIFVWVQILVCGCKRRIHIA